MFRAIPVVPSEVSLPRHPNWSWDYDKGQTFDRLIEAQHWATGVIIGWPNVVTYVEIRDDHGVVQVFDNPDFGARDYSFEWWSDMNGSVQINGTDVLNVNLDWREFGMFSDDDLKHDPNLTEQEMDELLDRIGNAIADEFNKKETV